MLQILDFQGKRYKVTFEYKIGKGESVDIVAKRDGKRVVKEIEAVKSNLLWNLK